jgi:hypothetical protein
LVGVPVCTQFGEKAVAVGENLAENPAAVLARAGSPASDTLSDRPATRTASFPDMADMDVALKDAMQISGAIGVALVDHTSGMALGIVGGDKNFDLNGANLAMARHQLRNIERALEV